jgi:hypothetical protein
MAGLIFLVIGLLCSLVGRVLLAAGAFGISVWWGFGIFLPFGPALFRLSYPDVAPASRMFRLAALPCLVLYLVLGPFGMPIRLHHGRKVTSSLHGPRGYATEIPAVDANARSANVADRAAVVDREFDRLRVWSEKLRLEKRDLLHSDVEGNRAYGLELAKYNAALAQANADKSALAAAAHK